MRPDDHNWGFEQLNQPIPDQMKKQPGSPATKITPKQRIAQLEAQLVETTTALGQREIDLSRAQHAVEHLSLMNKSQRGTIEGLRVKVTSLEGQLAITTEQKQTLRAERDNCIDRFQGLRCAILDYFMAKDSGNCEVMDHARKSIVENIITRASR